MTDDNLVNLFYGTKNVRKSDKYDDKLQRLKQSLGDGKSKLWFISDFDHTLSSFKSIQCHDIFYHNNDEQFIEEFDTLLKTPMSRLQDWWVAAHDLILEKASLTKPRWEKTLSEYPFHMRAALKELFVTLQTHRIPFILLSAGITNVIEHNLKHYGIPYERGGLFEIDANVMEFDDDDNLMQFLPDPPVHSHSKPYMCLRVSSIFPDASLPDDDEFYVAAAYRSIASASKVDTALTTVTQPDRLEEEEVMKSVVVMGDRATDFKVLHCCSNVYMQFNIGFARNDSDAQELIEAGCDVVIIGEEHGLEPVVAFIDDLTNL